MDTTHIALGDRLIPLSIRRLRNARRITLRLSPARDGIILTLPVRASVVSGMQFFHSKAGWVLANVEADEPVSFEDGSTLPIQGQHVTIRRLGGRGITTLENGELTICCAPEFLKRRIKDFLKKEIHRLCLEQASRMAKSLNKNVRTVRIRDMRSRWGSCGRDGTLTFHWQLIFAPPDILNYLIAHEVAHLKEMNHSNRFWQVVGHLYPEYNKASQWLKIEGHRLHRYR